MKELECYARTCVHNDKCACKKDSIDVENSQKVAKCMDYEPVGATKYSYETAEERSFGATSHYSTDIHCSVCECEYNKKEKCEADHVTINVDEVNEYGKVKCETFKKCNNNCKR